MLHEVVQALETIYIGYSYKAILSSGHSLPASTCEPVIILMDQTCTLFQSRLLRHSIDSLSTPNNVCPYFQRSIEWIPTAQTNQQGPNNQQGHTTRGNNSRGIVTRRNSGRSHGDNSNVTSPLVNEK